LKVDDMRASQLQATKKAFNGLYSGVYKLDSHNKNH